MTQYSLNLSDVVGENDVSGNSVEFSNIERIVGDVISSSTGFSVVYWENVKAIDIDRVGQVAIVYGVEGNVIPAGLGGVVKFGEYTVRAVVKLITIPQELFLEKLNLGVMNYEQKASISTAGEKLVYLNLENEDIDISSIRGAVFISLAFKVRMLVGVGVL